MKKVIGCKLYDSGKARRIYVWHSGHKPGDHRHAIEVLYKSAKGAWFIHGEGGPLTRFRRKIGDEFLSGEDILPLSPKEALAWLEEHNGHEAAVREFGDLIEEA